MGAGRRASHQSIQTLEATRVQQGEAAFLSRAFKTHRYDIQAVKLTFLNWCHSRNVDAGIN